MNKALPLIIFLMLAVLVGCGGGGGGQAFAPPPPSMVTSVAVLPAATTLPVGQIQQFTGTVQGTGSFNPAVNWEVNDIVGGNTTVGTISANGLYTAPTSLSASPFTVAIKAASVQDPTKFGTANATTHVTVAISPSPINVPTQAHQAFLAKVDGSSNGTVNWSATVGTITDLGMFTVNGVPVDVGLYQSPRMLPAPATLNITAAAQVDPAQSATASANLFIPQNRSSEPLPVVLGTSGGNEKDFPTANSCASGTLGSLAVRRDGSGSFILSNNHVLALSNAGMIGDPISQPGLIEVNCALANVKVIANLSQFANLQTANVDAAIAVIQPGAVNTTGAILGFGAGNSSAPPANSVVPAAIGMPVAKSGRTTGLTCAHVRATNVTVRVDYQPPSGMLFTVTFSNQILIVDDANVPGFSDRGDSGSLVVNSQTAQPVGLLFAGGDLDTVANPINDVLAAFPQQMLAIAGGPEHLISCPTPTPTFVTAQTEAQAGKAEVSGASLAQAKGVKEKHEKELMADPAVISVGITASDDRPGEAAILVLVERGKLHGPIPSEIEGVQVKVQDSSRFRALGGAGAKRKKQRRACCHPPGGCRKG